MKDEGSSIFGDCGVAGTVEDGEMTGSVELDIDKRASKIEFTISEKRSSSEVFGPDCCFSKIELKVLRISCWPSCNIWLEYNNELVLFSMLSDWSGI